MAGGVVLDRPPHAAGTLDDDALLIQTAQLRERYRMAGYDPDSLDVHQLVDRGALPLRGGATGVGSAAFMHNLPEQGSYVMDQAAFARETERNDMPLEPRTFPGLGGAPLDTRVPNVGVWAWLRVIFVGTLVVGGTGAVTATYQWPWNTIKRFQINLNGQTSLISAEGLDLRSRRSRIFRHPREEVSTAPATDAATGNPAPGVIANGSYPVVLAYDIPIVHDAYTLTGALYAQSDQTYLQHRIQPGAQAELFSVASGGTVALTGTFHTQMTFYDIPYDEVQGKGRVVLLPDLRWLHGFLAADKPFANTGEVEAPLIRVAGQLIAYQAYLDNGGAAQIDPTVWTELRFEYGGNRRPRTYNPVSQLLEKNGQDYSGRIRPGTAVLDFEADNPERELVYPKGVTELKSVATLPQGTVVNANARAHFVEESLFVGRG